MTGVVVTGVVVAGVVVAGVVVAGVVVTGVAITGVVVRVVVAIDQAKNVFRCLEMKASKVCLKINLKNEDLARWT